MAILFRCPCGRSMVADTDKAGSLITCPNCHRSLRVPTGKGRGKTLAAVPSTATQTTRQCGSCGRSVPVDAQACPHCHAPLDGEAPVAALPDDDEVPVKAQPAEPRRASTGTDFALRYGGARGGWFSQMSTGGKVGLLLGVLVGAPLVLGLVSYFMYRSWHHGQIETARRRARTALEQGQALEREGRFQEAYDTYYTGLVKEQFLAEGLKADRALVEDLYARTGALQFIVTEPKTRESLRWKPNSQREFVEAQNQIAANYPVYRERVLNVVSAGEEAVQAGREGNKVAFDSAVGRAVQTFIVLASETMPQQRATYSFAMVVSSVRDLTGANREWANEASRAQFMEAAAARFDAIRKLVNEPPMSRAGDKIR